jgi:hypothetical protein
MSQQKSTKLQGGNQPSYLNDVSGGFLITESPDSSANAGEYAGKYAEAGFLNNDGSGGSGDSSLNLNVEY